jgi:hypothetical protein
MKYLATAFVTAVIVFLAVTVYYRGFPVFPAYNKDAVSTQGGLPVTSTETPTPSASPSGKVIVKSGGVLVFKAYSLELPSDWAYVKEGQPTGDVPMDKLTLTKGGTKITIYQAATGGAQCLYPGDPDVEGPSSRFTSFVGITTQTGEMLRRGTAEGSTGFTVCEKQGAGGYGQPTSFGHISITTTGTPNASVIVEIDSILSSLKKI